MKIDGNDTDETISIKSVNQIMERFDFKKVHQFMIDTNHKWASHLIDTEPSVPSIENIKLTCLRLLTETVKEFNPDKPYGNYGTGGFVVYHFPWGMELVYSYVSARTY